MRFAVHDALSEPGSVGASPNWSPTGDGRSDRQREPSGSVPSGAHWSGRPDGGSPPPPIMSSTVLSACSIGSRNGSGMSDVQNPNTGSQRGISGASSTGQPWLSVGPGSLGHSSVASGVPSPSVSVG